VGEAAFAAIAASDGPNAAQFSAKGSSIAIASWRIDGRARTATPLPLWAATSDAVRLA
jgi:hypothetical protein